MKQLLITILTMFCLNFVCAQSHNPGPNSNCKLNKNYRPNIEKISCPACDLNDKKEKVAIVAEDKRRSDVVLAKVRAEEAALQIAFQEEKRLKLEEAKRNKDKEIADKITNDAMVKKNKEIAEKGRIKSTANGKAVKTKFDIDKIKPFSDEKRKVYGFIIDDVEVKTFPFNEFEIRIDRLRGTNYFSIDVYSEAPTDYESSVYKHSYIINYSGEKMKIDGNTIFGHPIYPNENTKTIDLFTIISFEKLDFELASSNGGVGKFHQDKESAIADVNANAKAGWDMFFEVKMFYETRYVVDFNFNLLEKSNGYAIKRQ